MRPAAHSAESLDVKWSQEISPTQTKMNLDLMPNTALRNAAKRIRPARALHTPPIIRHVLSMIRRLRIFSCGRLRRVPGYTMIRTAMWSETRSFKGLAAVEDKRRILMGKDGGRNIINQRIWEIEIFPTNNSNFSLQQKPHIVKRNLQASPSIGTVTLKPFKVTDTREYSPTKLINSETPSCPNTSNACL